MLPLKGLNHISIVVSDVPKSIDFYKHVLGFLEIARPRSFEFEGSWLMRDNVAIHLIEGKPVMRSKTIDPKADHISFVSCVPLSIIESMLEALGIEFVKETTNEQGMVLEQIFFHDLDHNMIEICNCDTLPVCVLERPSDDMEKQDSRRKHGMYAQNPSSTRSSYDFYNSESE